MIDDVLIVTDVNGKKVAVYQAELLSTLRDSSFTLFAMTIDQIKALRHRYIENGGDLSKL